jgi:hypothetical protein
MTMGQRLNFGLRFIDGLEAAREISRLQWQPPPNPSIDSLGLLARVATVRRA